MGFINSCKDACDDINCGANGTCVDGTCNCDPGFSGATCDINVCETVDCNNGTCDPVTGACACNEGYEGDFCETEIREKHFGVYTGDLTPCVPAFLAGLIPEEQLEALMMTPIAVSASSDGIFNIIIADEGGILGFSIEANINEPNFDIEAFEQDLDLGGQEVTITGEGTGSIVDEDNMEIMLSLGFKALGITFPADCTVTFTKG